VLAKAEEPSTIAAASLLSSCTLSTAPLPTKSRL
jgi:hypothetical protein